MPGLLCKWVISVVHDQASAVATETGIKLNWVNSKTLIEKTGPYVVFAVIYIHLETQTDRKTCNYPPTLVVFDQASRRKQAMKKQYTTVYFSTASVCVPISCFHR